MIQRDSPVRVAMRPSSDAASLSVTSGRPRSHEAGEAGDQLVARGAPRRRPPPSMPARAQARGAAAAHVRVGIARPEHDAADAGGEHRVGARRRAAVMVARLEGHVERRAARRGAGRAQRLDLAVRGAGARGASRGRRRGRARRRRRRRAGLGLVRPRPRRAEARSAWRMNVGVASAHAEPDVARLRRAPPRRERCPSFTRSCSSRMNSPTSWNERYTEAKRT